MYWSVVIAHAVPGRPRGGRAAPGAGNGRVGRGGRAVPLREFREWPHRSARDPTTWMDDASVPVPHLR